MSLTIDKPLAWLSDPDLKEQVVLKMKEHRAEDAIIQGEYQIYAPELATQYKGCLLGCTLPKMVDEGSPEGKSTWGWHQRVTKLYGIPGSVAYLLEAVFESLPQEHAASFAVDCIEAIPVGADLSQVAYYYDNRGGSNCLCADCNPHNDRLMERDLVLGLLRNAPVPQPA